MQNIIDNDWKKGLEEYRRDALLFHNAPSVLNRSSLVEDYTMSELEALANDEMYQGRGLRRYDGTWATPEDVLDDDIFGDDMMRISYEEGQLNLKDWDLTKSLGWLSNTNQNLKNYIEASDDETKQAYYDTLDGKTKELLKNIDQYTPTGSDVKGRFTLMYDEEGNPYWQEVLTDSNTRKKLETAGVSLVNSYGSKNYADGALKSGVRSFAKGIADIIPGIVQFGAMIEDLGEATSNAIAGNGFVSDYDDLNQIADDMQDWVDNSMVGKTSDKTNDGLFDNWESFASGLGQGASSLVGYLGIARAASFVGTGAKALTKGAGNLLSKSGISALAKGGEKVVQTLSAQNLNSNSLGTVAKSLNKLLVENPGTVSMYSAGMVLNSGEAYKAARQAGLPLEDAATIGLVTGIANTLVEQKYGPNTLNKWLAGSKGAETAAKTIIKEIGGDVKKLDDISTSKNILGKIVSLAGKAMNAPVVGTALEEGSEEMIQGFVKNAVESFYDSYISPNSATEGQGKFGTRLFGKEEWTGMLEEGTIGAILGAFGGFANSRRKENESIIPFIANGDFETLKAGAALAKAKGAISQEQYNGIMERANALNELHNENSEVFNDIKAIAIGSEQLDATNKALQVLRDQKDYAESKQDLSTGESLLSSDQKFRSILDKSLNITPSLAGVKAFASQLRNNGKRQDADKLLKLAKQSEKQANDIIKTDKNSSVTAKLATNVMRQTVAKQIFNLQNDINSTESRIAMWQQVQKEAASLDTIAAINEQITNSSVIKKSNERIEKLLEEYESDSTSEDRRNTIGNEINKELDKQQKAIISSKPLTGQLGVKEYAEAQKNIQGLTALKRKRQAELSFLMSNDTKEGIKELQQLIDEKEKETKANVEREKELNKKKEQEETATTNDAVEKLYSDYKNSLSAETDVTPERKKRIDSVINGDELTQVNELEAERQDVVKALNNLPKEEKSSPRADLLREDLKRLNKIIPYLRSKYNITKTEADKNKRYKTNLTTDESVYTDNENNKYTIDRPSTQYSENEGLIYSIKKEGDEESKEYSENQDGEFLNQLVDEAGIPLSVKIRQDKRTVAMQLRKVSPELAFTFEPVSEAETKIDTTKQLDERVNKFVNKLKCLLIGDVFKSIVADPKTDAKLFTGRAEAYIWDKADNNSKEAKQLFDSLRASKKSWSDLSQEEKDKLIDYLPVQLKLVHPYIKKGDKEYENTVAIPARKSATSKDRPMHDDQITQREALISNLLENGTYEVKKGDIEIQPGYFNTDDSTKPNTVVDPVTGETYTLSDLPSGDLRDVESLGIVKENGQYYVTLPKGKETKKMRLTIAIAGQTGTIGYTYITEKGDVVTRHAEGQGSPGTPYLIIPGFLNLNNKTAAYPLKLNPRRIDKNSATTIAKLMYALAKGYASKQVLLNSPILSLDDVFGIKTQDKSLTVGDVLDDLIYWGNRTRQNDPDPENNKDYLKNKQVYIDFKKGVVKYGEKETVLGDGEAELNKFIHWIMNNKSFAIDRSRINANDVIANTYEIEGGVSFVEGTDYSTMLIDNKFVATNLNPKGPLFRGQAIRLNTIRSNKKSNPVIQPKPTNKPKEVKKPTVSSVSEQIESFLNEDGVRKNAKAMKAAMQSINGTITVSGKNGDTSIYDSNDKVLGNLTEFTFTVEDGKINGEVVDYDATFSKKSGVFGVIEKIVREKYPTADLRGLLETATFTPTVTQVAEESEKPIVNNPRVDEVYKKAIDSISKKFKNKKPSKTDMTEALDALVNSSVNRAQLYGFKDYKEARQLLKEVGSNGKTLEQMLIDYMSNMSSEQPSTGDALADIAATVFTGKNKKKGVTRLISDKDKKEGYNKMSESEKKQLNTILGRRRPIKWAEQLIDALDYVGNPAKAFGVTMKAVTEIYNGAKEGTGYHESFHNVSLFALSSEERQQMYEEARKRYSEIADKDNKLVEEFLADKFMNYALTMQEQGKVNAMEYKGLSGFFKKMWDWVKSFFGVKPNYQDLNTFFKKLYSGQYANVRTNKESLVYFDNTYGKDGKVPLMINGKTLNMDSRVFSKIVDNLTAQLLFDSDITSLESVRRGINFEEFKDKLVTIRDTYANVINTSDDFDLVEGATALVSIYNELLDNWTSVFKPFIEGKLANYGIRRRAEDATITIDEDLKNLINDEIVSAWEINSKHNAKAEVRMLFLALKKSSTPDSITKLPQYENPDVVWYNTISKLHSAKSFDEMMERLDELSNETNKLTGDKINPYSELKKLILESGNETLKTQFFITMKKHKNKFINMTFSEDGNGLDMRIADADINKRSKKINAAWSKAFAQTNPLTKEGKESIRALQKNYQQLLADVKNEAVSIENNILKTVELLAGLNIVVDDATIQNIMQDPNYRDKNGSDKKSLNEFLLSNEFSNVFANKGKTVLNNILQDRIDTSKIDTLLANEKLSSIVARSYVKMNPSSEDDSVLGPQGNAVYAYSENNTITSMFEEWLKDEEFLAELNQDVYSQNSKWLEQLKDGNVRRQLGVKTMLAVMNRDDYSTSRGYLDISDKEDIIIKLKAVLDSKMVLPTLANKKSYYFIDGLKKELVKLNYTKDAGYQLNDSVVETFKGYALDELNSIKLAFKQKEEFLNAIGLSESEFNDMNAREQRSLIESKLSDDTFKVAYSDLVENYHFALVSDDIKNEDGTIFYDKKMVLRGNGYMFRYFRELDETLASNGVEYVEKLINSESFENKIRLILNARVNETIKLFIDNGIINVDKKLSKSQKESLTDDSQIAVESIIEKAYNYIPIDKKGDMMSAKDAIASAIADYAINTAVSTIEFEKVVSGDLAFYKTDKKGKRSISAALDDRVKRYSALTSTRQMMNFGVKSNDAYDVDFDTQHYRSITLSTNTSYSKEMYDVMYNKYVGTIENPGLLYQRFIDFAEKGIGRYSGKDREQLFEMAQQNAEERLGGYLSTDPTDAQVWISPVMFRKLSILNGEWSAAKEEAYKLLESDEPLTEEQELKANLLVMQPLKYVHYGFMYNSKGLKIPVYDKMSLATVFKRNARGTNLKPMYDYMIQNDVDMVKMESAVKSGNRPKQAYYNQNGEVNDLNNSLVYEQDFKFIGKQLVTDPHEVERSTLLTQFIKIAVSNVNKEDSYELDGRTITGQQLLDQYNSAIENLSHRGVERIRQKFGFKDGKVDKRKLVKMLNEAALQTNVPQNLLDALQYSEQDNDYYIELSTLPSLNWIHSRIISLISKETIDITTPGNAFYQTTSFGHDLTGNYRKMVGDNTVKKYDDKLRFKNENGRLEVKLSINLFRGAIPSKYKTFEEQRKYILANKELFAFSYRVPTQGMNSTLPIEIVDIVPTNSGDVIFLPLEVTALTGSDFDIDKMYLARYNYYDENGKMKKVQFIDRDDYSSEEEFLDAIWHNRYSKVNDANYVKDRKDVLGVVEYVAKRVGQNGALSTEDKMDLIDLAQDYSKYLSRRAIMSILDSRVDDFDGVNKVRSYIERSIPTKKDVIPVEKFIEKNKGKSMWDLNKEEAVENRLLEIFGATLTSNNHYIDATTPLDVTTAPIIEVADKMKKYFESNQAVQSLAPLFPSYQEDMKSKNTGADAGIGPMALINVFRTFLQIADIQLNTVVGENNIMQKLGIDTLNKTFDDEGLSILDWTSALINAHVDAAKDPYIIRLNVNKYTYNMTAFMISAGFGKSTFYFLPQPILKDLANNYMRVTGSDIGIEGFEKYSKKYLSDVIEDYESMISKKAPKRVDEDEVIHNMRDIQWLENQIKTPENERDDEWYATQLTILDVFLKIQEYADGMRDAINAVQIDTKKYGINSAELIQFGHLVEKVENSEYFANPKDLFDKTFIGAKYKNSIKLMFDLLGTEVMDFSPGFVSMVEEIEKMTYTYYKRDERVVNGISNEIKSALYGQFFNSYLERNNKSVKDLFYGENSVVARIGKLQKQIAEGEYRELKDNELLKMLLPNVFNNDTDPMTFENSTTKQRDTDSKNAYTFAWMDLLEHEDEYIQQLGNDLILYSFYMGGGLSNGVYNFYDLAPYGYLANMEVDGKTFQDYVKNLMITLNQDDAVNQLMTQDLLDSVFKSAWKNKDLVPEISLKSKGKEKSITVQSDKNGDTEYIRLSSTYTGFMTGMDGYFKPYVKLYNKKNPNDTQLFKLVGYFETETGLELVYGKTNKLGFDYKGFRIKESTTKSALPTNNVPTDFSEDLQLGDKIKHGDVFTAVNPFDTFGVTQPGINVTSEGDIESKIPTEKGEETLSTSDSDILNQYLNNGWSRYSDNGYEVSSQGDKRFSALYAKFAKDTIIEGVDVGGKTIEWVYQNVIKKSGKGKAPSKDSILYNPDLKTSQEQEDFSYNKGYLPLWQKWAKQNPELIDELRGLSNGKTLTDKFASTRVSQARALSDILNNTKQQRPSEKC